MSALPVDAYAVQAKSYDTMQQAANMAAQAEDTAGIGKLIGGGLKLAGAVASLFTGNPLPAIEALACTSDPSRPGSLY